MIQAWNDDLGEYYEPYKRKSVPQNKVALNLWHIWSDMCHDFLGTRPVQAKGNYFIILNALKHLTEEQIVDLFENWFKGPEDTVNKIQITRALSGNQINKFKVERKI